jgi:hypothetical protein
VWIIGGLAVIVFAFLVAPSVRELIVHRNDFGLLPCPFTAEAYDHAVATRDFTMCASLASAYRGGKGGCQLAWNRSVDRASCAWDAIENVQHYQECHAITDFPLRDYCYEQTITPASLVHCTDCFIPVHHCARVLAVQSNVLLLRPYQASLNNTGISNIITARCAPVLWQLSKTPDSGGILVVSLNDDDVTLPLAVNITTDQGMIAVRLPGSTGRQEHEIARNCSLSSLYYVTNNGSTYYMQTTCGADEGWGMRNIYPWDADITAYQAYS